MAVAVTRELAWWLALTAIAAGSFAVQALAALALSWDASPRLSLLAAGAGLVVCAVWVWAMVRFDRDTEGRGPW